MTLKKRTTELTRQIELTAITQNWEWKWKGIHIGLLISIGDSRFLIFKGKSLKAHMIFELGSIWTCIECSLTTWMNIIWVWCPRLIVYTFFAVRIGLVFHAQLSTRSWWWSARRQSNENEIRTISASLIRTYRESKFAQKPRVTSVPHCSPSENAMVTLNNRLESCNSVIRRDNFRTKVKGPVVSRFRASHAKQTISRIKQLRDSNCITQVIEPVGVLTSPSQKILPKLNTYVSEHNQVIKKTKSELIFYLIFHI